MASVSSVVPSPANAGGAAPGRAAHTAPSPTTTVARPVATSQLRPLMARPSGKVGRIIPGSGVGQDGNGLARGAENRPMKERGVPTGPIFFGPLADWHGPCKTSHHFATGGS